MTNKLKLKRTPEEEAQHRLKKERRRAKRKRKENDSHFHGAGPRSSKRTHVDAEDPEEPQRKWASSDEDEEYQHGPQPASTSSSHIPPPPRSAHKPDYDTMKAEIDDKLFREKMFDNLQDDERLDAVEAHMNDFAHVPDRWRTPGSGSGLGGGKGRKNFYEEDNEGLMKLDPRYMEDEEYAEWIRAGMYRKTHAEEYAEQQRKKAAHAARRAEEKARKAEAARLEKAAEEERKRRKAEREERRLDYAREEYNMRWGKLLASGDDSGLTQPPLGFDDVPWPIAVAHRSKPEKDRRRHSHAHANAKAVEDLPPRPTDVEDLTAEAIASFLLPPDLVVGPGIGPEVDRVARKKERRDKLRETFLRFHPDKFEGRFMKRFREGERERVREAIGQVSRVLNGLMGEGD